MVVTRAVCALVLVASALAVPAGKSLDASKALLRFDGAAEVTFFLYTQGNPTTPELIKIDDDSTSPSFNPNNPTKFAIHGGNSNADMMKEVKNAYIATGNEYNLVLVDWSRIAAQEELVAASNSILVGDYIGQAINHLIEARGLRPDALAIIGHSMGGQVAAIAGNRVGGGSAAEVVALDPASDIYDDNRPEDQLDPSDARFVQVIHTEGGGLGVLDARGDADFFPNGGSEQAGCSLAGICNHKRAVDYFVESISSKEFVAALCSSYEDYLQGECSSNLHVVMGEFTPLNTSGLFYLKTNADSPFAQGETDL